MFEHTSVQSHRGRLKLTFIYTFSSDVCAGIAFLIRNLFNLELPPAQEPPRTGTFPVLTFIPPGQEKNRKR